MLMPDDYMDPEITSEYPSAHNLKGGLTKTPNETLDEKLEKDIEEIDVKL